MYFGKLTVEFGLEITAETWKAVSKLLNSPGD